MFGKLINEQIHNFHHRKSNCWLKSNSLCTSDKKKDHLLCSPLTGKTGVTSSNEWGMALALVQLSINSHRSTGIDKWAKPNEANFSWLKPTPSGFLALVTFYWSNSSTMIWCQTHKEAFQVQRAQWEGSGIISFEGFRCCSFLFSFWLNNLAFVRVAGKR